MPIQLPSDTFPLNVELQLAALNIFFIHDMFKKIFKTIFFKKEKKKGLTIWWKRQKTQIVKE